MQLDHMILNVNDVAESIAFYTDVLGLKHEGEDGPFAVMRIDEGTVLLLARWSTMGGEHLAFSMSPAEFESVFARIRSGGIAYGDSFDSVGSMKGPGNESGARGMGKAVYFFDPSRHLIEIRCYDA